MKKVILATVILAGTVSNYATNINKLPIHKIVHVNQSQNFIEISLDKLPEAVISALQKEYPQASISKAFINKKEQYKLELIIKKELKVVYADKNGKWLNEEEINK
ncbi:conserved protein of unknown function [Tenacibaculum sp. 190524A02b]|uniref:Beta-lactamase-inhibitor-like PepSY-like domain-containing protein n=1 Tax=Tenacibaculum vairaonense TaxID=3137860 RepID=A0ABP1FDT2_9FLAO